jgi:HlyD family secretion protein
MKKSLVITLIIAITASAGVYFSSTNNSEIKATTVELTNVAKNKIIQKVNATGKIQPKTKINISADVSAKIINLYVAEGEWVEKGKLLVELDREKYLASVESQEANVRASQANSKLVKANMLQSERVWKRSKEMFEKNLDSQSTLDATDAAYQVEVARYEASLEQVEQSRGMLKRARDDLSKTTMYAPMEGTISKLNKEAGEIAIGSQFQEDVIMTIANLNEMEALVNVDENDIIAIKLNQAAEIEVDALSNTLITGIISEIATSAKEAQNGQANQKTEFEVTIAITSDSTNLRPGMTTSANIITDTRNDALSVPIQSVTVRTIAQLTEDEQFKGKEFTSGKDGFVELVFVEKNGNVQANQVKTGIQSNDLIEIIEGVELGDAIVSGSYRAISRDLKNGDKVKTDKNKDESEGK